MRLEGKVAVVTGAGRGIGRAIAIKLARSGADLLLLDICQSVADVPYELASRSQLDYTASECARCGSSCLAEQADVRDSSTIDLAVDKSLDRFGRIDILVNNAGIAAPAGKIVHEIDEWEWKLMLDVDLNGAWRMIRAVGQTMVRLRSGSIINVASTAGVVGYRHFSAYVAAKHGLIGLTRAAALDYGPYRIRVNAVNPGSVRDDPSYEGIMLSQIAKVLSVPVSEHEATFVESQPNNTLVEASAVADAVGWLASDESKHVTGSVITVDGGYTAR